MTADVKRVARLRGTTAQLALVAGQPGETIVDTDKNTVTVHDGEKLGGYPLLREDGDGSELALAAAVAGAIYPRAMKEWLGDTINVLVFVPPGYHAAIRAGTSSYDCTAAFQAAWNAAKARGRAKIRAPGGRYVVNGTVISDASNVTMVGDGRRATHIYKGGAGDLFTLTGSFLTIRDLMMESPLGHTSGYCLNFASPGGNMRVENVDSFRGWSGVYFGGAQSQIHGCILNQLAFDGVVFGPNTGLSSASRVSLFGLATNTGAGFKFLGGDTYQLSGIQVTSHKTGYLLQPPADGFLYNLFATICFADGVGMTTMNGDGWLLDATAAGAVIRRTRLIGCWGSAMTRDGMRTVGDVEDTEIHGAVCVTNLGHGLNIIGSPTPTHTRVIGGLFAGNSAPNFGRPVGVYSGIYVGDYVGDITILGARCGPTASIASTQKYGIEFGGTNHSGYIVSKNDVRGNLLGAIQLQALGPVGVREGNLGDTVTYQTAGPLTLQSLTGEVQILGTDGSVQVGVGTAAGATLRLLLKGSSPGGNAVVAMTGTGNGNLALFPSGAGYGVLLDAQRASWVAAVGGAAGAAPVLAAQSFTDGHVDLALAPQGANGRVRFGTRTATADAPVTGYIEIKDSSGNLRKLAVID
ncbi:hypothetical protein GBZ26_04065 [Azospirillum formosense]|uniref:Major tropism determinant N-terminal domain-containing protein n=1 Tax=Azospirillum formosense TaxID=861533 RepID=A0ABX2KQJ6_9PROT|nr:hypothetical protein [Azospirillum formosense]MBY3755724.1 hypothetical protein [Azospirillum formosense]NUB18400.1 hypothetical protein [Azospirillum formosense]